MSNWKTPGLFGRIATVSLLYCSIGIMLGLLIAVLSGHALPLACFCGFAASLLGAVIEWQM